MLSPKFRTKRLQFLMSCVNLVNISFKEHYDSDLLYLDGKMTILIPYNKATYLRAKVVFMTRNTSYENKRLDHR